MNKQKNEKICTKINGIEPRLCEKASHLGKKSSSVVLLRECSQRKIKMAGEQLIKTKKGCGYESDG